MGTDLEEVLARLPRLSDAELDAVNQRIKVCRSLSSSGMLTSGAEVISHSDDSMLVISAITRTLKNVGIDSPHPTVLLKRLSTEAFQAKSTALLKFIRSQTINRIEQLTLLNIGADLLYRDMLNWSKRPVGARNMMYFIDTIVPIFNSHFPGYAENGLLVKIIRSQRNDRSASTTA